MKRNPGFTLVELLVVMAIIAILASIVVPNVQRYIVRARVTKAVAEVSGMELSLTAILTDAGRGNLSQIFVPGAPQHPSINWPISDANPALFTPEIFNNAADVYSQVVYDLLRLGRDSLKADSGAIADDFINHDVLAKLGTNYMDIGLDPWGQIYRVWPGPWRFSTVNIPAQIAGAVSRWPIPFRIFSVDSGTGGGASAIAVQKDKFMVAGPGNYFDDLTTTDIVENGLSMLAGVIVDPETWPTQVGLPAQANQSAFIWSYGGNARSSQMLYKGVYAMDPFDWYYTESEEDIAGGDDVNNWDNGTSWQRFYQ